jgi:hypothetical protein
VSWRLLLALTALTLTLTGCIRRYPAPEEPEQAVTPYSAFAAMHAVQPPSGPDGAPLPAVALRLAISPRGWLADTMLVDGTSGTLQQEAGDPAAALGLLADRPEPIVVLVDRELIGSPSLCELMTMLGDGALLATGALAFGRDAATPRAEADGLSRDPLGGVSVSHACPKRSVD